MSVDSVKRAVGAAAAELVEGGMVVGLGTGSTAACFIKSLGERCKNGLLIKAVASSKASWDLAKRSGIPLLDIDTISTLDITVDGADEIDSHKRMIKGGGGAFVREKIVASMSQELIVILDESKLVSQLGKRKLPVEILPFSYNATLHHLAKAGYQGAWRKKPNGTHYFTDNENLIFDIQFSEPCAHPEREHEMIRRIPGVIDTGFFFDLAGRIIIGFLDGQIVIQP